MTYQTTKNLTYCIIEDIEDVIFGINKRMSEFPKWKNVDNSTEINNAIDIIATHFPDLIFMDWHIKGGSTYELLDWIAKNNHYNPYIIYFTGYQKDEPEIPMKILNDYHVDKYLIKPIWKNLSENLKHYLNEATDKIKLHSTVQFKDIHKNIINFNPKDITSVTLYDPQKRTKSIRLINGDEIIVKKTFNDIEKTLSNYCIPYLFTNKRFSLVTKTHINKIEHDFVVFHNNKSPKVEIAKENLKNIKEWLIL